MTRRADFKRLVRERMDRTGEKYTEAKRGVEAILAEGKKHSDPGRQYAAMFSTALAQETHRALFPKDESK